MSRSAPRLLMVVNELESFFNHRLPAALAASESGYDVHVALKEDTAATGRNPGAITFHHLPLARNLASPYQELRTLFALRKLLRSLRPDLVHAFTLKPVTLAGLAARMNAGPPLVASVTGVGSFFLATGAKAAAMRAVMVPALRAALAHKPLMAIVQNPDDRALVTGTLGVPPARCTLVPGSGVDLETFRPAPTEPPPPVRIVLAARMLADKGIREFADAARQLRRAGIQADFVLAGGLDPANRSAIFEDEIRRWEHDGILRWAGHVRDMAALNARAHVACLPSYREGLPKSLIEAAASGLPIVTTDVPGCREIVRPGESGLLVPPRDPAALAAALRRLIEDAELRRRMGVAGRRLAETGFSVESINAQILAVYDRLLTSA